MKIHSALSATQDDVLVGAASDAALALAGQERIILRAVGKATHTIGGALLTIRDNRLYCHGAFEQFEEYCDQFWGFKRSRAYQYIDFHKVVRNLSTPVEMQGVPLPQTEAQSRPLLQLKTAEGQATVWKDVLERHGERATMAQVQESVERHLAIQAGNDRGDCACEGADKDSRKGQMIPGKTTNAPAPNAVQPRAPFSDITPIRWDLGAVRAMVTGLCSSPSAWVAAITKDDRAKVNDLIGELYLLAEFLEGALESHNARRGIRFAQGDGDGAHE